MYTEPLRKFKKGATDDLINDLCVVFARDNGLFSRSRFVSACKDE